MTCVGVSFRLPELSLHLLCCALSQGTSADITKETLSLLLPRLLKIGGQLVMCVHDEIIAEVPEERAEEVWALRAETFLRRQPLPSRPNVFCSAHRACCMQGLELLLATMREAGGLFLTRVPCEAEGRIGDSWADKP